MKCKGVTITLSKGVHHDNSARREVHEQTAAGGCECRDRFNKGTAVAANPPFIVFEIGTTLPVSINFVTSLEF